MKSGLKIGQIFETEFVVTADMFANFPTGLVHELLSTSSLVHQMEWAARQLILPYLEPHEEAMGARVEVHHSVMTPLGVTVKVKATVVELLNNKIECEVEAWHFRGKVAKGTIVQAVVDKSWIDKKVREMEIVEALLREQDQIKK